ncbi:placenta-specific gene 8 protein-like [Littorina saxatilis]|uniref:PLAC8 family protein n=1 Tax=Littorina saxatilis TaxID=31220 RepID=A0AAN9BNE1_9CAEN
MHPVMVGPAGQPLLQQPVQCPSAYYQPPSYYPPAAPAPAPAGPVQNNNTSQSIVINQPGKEAGGRMTRLFVDPEGVRGWSTGVFGCLNDITSCACACFCTPCLLCRVANRMNECAFIACAIPGGLTAMRVKLRTMGGIKGSICQDCLIVHFCPLLATCQMSRELDSMGL